MPKKTLWTRIAPRSVHLNATMKTDKRHVCNGTSVLGRSTLGILRKVDNTSKDAVRAVYETWPAQETRLAIGPSQQLKRPVNRACVER